ncbi:flagellar basal body L-ring protein FlgH [Gynuella sunshinyii]|uniref:Flagellar basal body L-ring protein n=1 Tax=Gynuella sunshinyii YC6258 TaxID=1445510 RepID=A0A0C5VEX3_9GAMM|nr:flagellar basal body L-ring protein FlgH [Gynuella sunshinyii]AJQ92721.1 flagellar basal body L-ring protein [Gynuella sunshinyii YC6258]
MKTSIYIGLLLLMTSHMVSAVSLYQPENYRAMVSAQRSHSVGDILTVMIYETATATTSASTDANAKTGIDIQASNGNNDLQAGVNAGSNFAGGGAVNRTGKVVANVSVVITGINDGGSFELAGEQRIKLNNEEQLIRVSGIVRPEDVSEQNMVISTRMADLKIDFIGDGLLTKSEKPGIFTRVFKWLF